MPSTTNTGSRTRQTRQPTPAAQPKTEGMFDDQQPEPPAAEQQAPEPDASGGDSVADRPDGDPSEQEVTPPANSVPDEPAKDEGTDATADQLDPIAAMALENSRSNESDPEDDHGQDEAPAPEPVPAPEPTPEPEPVVGPSSVEPEEVRLGQVTGLLHRLPLGDVQGLADTFATKIEALMFTAPVQALLPRMRATEGRCAPIYFTGDDDGEPEHLVAGDDALAAAVAAGTPVVSVVVIDPRDAGALQAYLAGLAGKASTSSEDDELVWRANGYHADR